VTEQCSQDGTAGTGQPGKDSQLETARTGQADRTFRIGLPVHDCHEWTARIGRTIRGKISILLGGFFTRSQYFSLYTSLKRLFKLTRFWTDKFGIKKL
jgi:hypothetical protein